MELGGSGARAAGEFGAAELCVGMGMEDTHQRGGSRLLGLLAQMAQHLVHLGQLLGTDVLRVWGQNRIEAAWHPAAGAAVCPVLLGLLCAQCCPQGRQPTAPAWCITHMCSGRSGVSLWPQQLLPWLQVRRGPGGTGWSAAGSRGPPAAPPSRAQPCKGKDTDRLCLFPHVPRHGSGCAPAPRSWLVLQELSQSKRSMVVAPSPQDPPAHTKAAKGHSSSSPSSTTIPLGICCRTPDQCAALAFAKVAPQAQVPACTLRDAGWLKQLAPALQGEDMAPQQPGTEAHLHLGDTTWCPHGVPSPWQGGGRERLCLFTPHASAGMLWTEEGHNVASRAPSAAQALPPSGTCPVPQPQPHGHLQQGHSWAQQSPSPSPAELLWGAGG